MVKNEISELKQRINNLYIEHPAVTRIWNRFDSMRSDLMTTDPGYEIEPRHIFVMGDSGVGKTQIATRYKKRNTGYIHVDEEGTEIDICPVVNVKLPYPFTQLEFFQKILTALGAPIFKYNPRVGEVKRRALELLQKQRVELLILDETNFIVTTTRISNVEGMEQLKDLSNIGLCLACFGTPLINQLRLMDDQYKSRFENEMIRRFELNDDFCDFLQSVEEQIEPPYSIGLGDSGTLLPELIHLWTEGTPRKIHKLIREVYRIVGVMDLTCSNLSEAKITLDTLKKAKDRVLAEHENVVM
ncbi:TniB family NTP-binding protein [Cytobacillus gottheilii]|uniref:TniB family NTP-binding protein n=1 Tax=Cytobacillus gottheilii TaxID=859144 RepID=UPI00249589B3|nr:TniB family NTP-binding protein [Cytobacillus gottheilii]